MIFIRFDDVKEDSIDDIFVDILNPKPIGKNITSIEFLEYISQPVVFLVISETGQKRAKTKMGNKL